MENDTFYLDCLPKLQAGGPENDQRILIEAVSGFNSGQRFRCVRQELMSGEIG
jgi:hypothetical protein